MLLTIWNDLKHYAGVCLVLVVMYFVGSSLISELKTVKFAGNAVVISAPTPDGRAQQALEDVAQALKDKALSDALSGRAADLSASQATIAAAISKSTGATAALAGALAEGLTKPSPKQQVIRISQAPTASLVAPPKAQSDDSIKADMKDVLASTTVKTQTSVSVSWEDKPYSPIFAAYQADGSTGVGYTLHKAPALNFDALLFVPTGSKPGVDVGAGIEHIFRGTSAGIGIDATMNMATHRPQFGLFAAVHS